ncbi:MAG: putative hydrolase or acyltransferase of alpha/beta superfamily [Ramlibacter sp.]|nr:putative hydrolase or acyltransferase of alpha/beta superfamily [Ramlibacter sp.]
MTTSHQTSGKALARQPTDVVFVHGFLDGASVWDDVMDRIGGDVRHVLALTLAGMGDRVHDTAPFTLERFVGDVERELARLERPVVLVGHSMGAQVAELVAARRPDRVAALVLLTPVPLAGTHLPEEAIGPFRALGGQPAAQRALRSQLSVALGSHALEKLGALGDRAAPAAVGAIADTWNNGHADGGKASRYIGPVLIIRGAKDPFVTEELVSSGVVPRFAKPVLVAVDNAGHWAQVEQPAAVAQVLLAFIASLAK